MDNIQNINKGFNQCFEKSSTFEQAQITSDIDKEVNELITRNIPQEISSYLDDSKYLVNGSVGKGRATKTPWIAILDKEITTSTREGVYIVFLFSSDYKHVYLTLNQGTTIPGQFGPRLGKKEISENSKRIRNLLNINNAILKTDGDADIVDERYKLGAIYYTLWDVNNAQKGETVLKLYLDIYKQYKKTIKDNTLTDELNKKYWIIPANNTKFRIIDLFNEREVVDWAQKQYKYAIGDKVYIYCSIGYQRILFDTEVIKTNITESEQIEDDKFDHRSTQHTKDNDTLYFRLKLKSKLKPDDTRLSLEKLREHGLNPDNSLQGSMTINDNHKLLQYIQSVFSTESGFIMEAEKQIDFSIHKIYESIQKTGLIYSDSLIKRLAFSLMAKPFVILSGLAGSGKTQLALAFAKCLSENIEEQVCTVSIGADWTNREPLLGYPNALNKDEYVKPESGVLQLLMRANEDPSKPYFLILDEMNLSVVERYFADFLSAMESGEKIKLWDNEAGNVPKEIELPKNVFIIGTINVDETTYMFSPKVLDRANVIEFKIAADEMEDYLGKKVNINLEQAYSACADMAVNFVTKAKSQVEKDEKNKDVLLSFFKELKEVNAEFGYRTVNEISRYLHFSEGDLSADSAIDTAILQKLLPKLHGSRKKLVPVLTSMWRLCLKDGITKEIDAEFNATDFKYPESAEKIQRMYKAVVDNGFTSFAEA